MEWFLPTTTTLTAIIFLVVLQRQQRLVNALQQAKVDFDDCRHHMAHLQRELDSLRRANRDLVIMVAVLSRHHDAGDEGHRRRLRRSLERQREELLRSLRHVEERIAMYAPAEVPISLTTERERLREAIHETEIQLDYLNGGAS